MTESKFLVRRMSPTDGEALIELALSSPDSGLIQIAPRYHLDAYQAMVALNPDTSGFVVEVADTGTLVGSGLVSFEQRYYEGRMRNCAWLHNLQVHPDYRRQGVATELAECRVTYAREEMGTDSVIVANIQQGNTGSFAVARTWCEQLLGETRDGAMGMRRKPMQLLPGVIIRPSTLDDLLLIAQELNAFHEGWNLYSPHTGESLAEWLASTPFAKPFRHYYVAEDRVGNLLAGIAIVEEYRIVEMQLEHLPVALQMLNKAVRLVPQNGKMRQLSATKTWYAPGHLQAAKYLWETVRWEWRERGDTLTFSYDPRSPLKNLFKTPLWIPQTSFICAISGPVPMSENRLIYTN